MEATRIGESLPWRVCEAFSGENAVSFVGEYRGAFNTVICQGADVAIWRRVHHKNQLDCTIHTTTEAMSAILSAAIRSNQLFTSTWNSSLEKDTIDVWDLDHGEKEYSLPFPERIASGVDGRVLAMEWAAPDRLATAREKELYIWDVENREIVKRFDLSRCASATNDLTSLSDGKLAECSGSMGLSDRPFPGELNIWDLESEGCMNLSHDAAAYQMSYDDNELVVTYPSKGIKMWDLRQEKVVLTIGDAAPPKVILNQVLYLKNVHQIISAPFDVHHFSIWDTRRAVTRIADYALPTPDYTPSLLAKSGSDFYLGCDATKSTSRSAMVSCYTQGYTSQEESCALL